MGRYVGSQWREDLPSLSPADQIQGNSEPIGSSSSSSSGGGGASSMPAANAPASTSGPVTALGNGLYQTVQGIKTIAQMSNELMAAGWSGATYGSQADVDQQVLDAYARTAQAPAASGTTPTGSTPIGTGTLDLNQLKQDILGGFQASAGMSVKELEERKRQFDENMAYLERQWTREGLPRLQIDQRLADLRAQEIANQQEQVRGNLGLQYLTAASQMGGPASVFQQADFLAGARQRGDVPQFLDALARNTQLPSFTGAGTTTLIPQTAGGLSLQLGGTPGASTPSGAAGAAATAPAASMSGPDMIAARTQELISHGMNPTQAGQTATAEYNQGLLQSGNVAYGTNVGRSTAAASSATGDAALIAQRAQELIGHGFDAVRAQQTAQSEYDQGYLQSGNVAYGTNVRFGTPALPTAPATPTTPASSGGLGTDPAGYSYDQALQTIGSIFKAGPTALQPGSLERLDPNELSILKSGATKLGYDPDQWLRAYQRAGIGQQASSAGV